MSAIDDYYDRMYESKRRQEDAVYNKIIKEFEDLTLEEKVDRLIKIYATKMAYN